METNAKIWCTDTLELLLAREGLEPSNSKVLNSVNEKYGKKMYKILKKWQNSNRK